MPETSSISDTRAAATLDPQLEKYRTELRGYCYRMLGSAFEADDAVQETMVRAWHAFDRFEGRSSVRSWLYRIATNVCFDLLNGTQRRARPIDLGPATTADVPLGEPLGSEAWIEPIPDGRVIPASNDPAEMAVSRESIRLAFVAALQHLPARQRAVLILRDVLRMSAIETAELLDTSVASANSALQRARATLESRDVSSHPVEPIDESQQALLARYVDAFERYDVDSFVALLHEDAVHSMPPFDEWLQGHAEIASFLLGPGIECRGSVLVPTMANGMPAFGQYRPSGPDGERAPWALHVVEISGGKVAAITYFLDTERYFPMFGLPPTPPTAPGTSS